MPKALQAVPSVGESQLVSVPALLQRIEQARDLLSSATTLEQVVGAKKMADAIQKLAKIAGMSLEIQNQAAKIKLEAERRSGELLCQMPKARGGRPKTPSSQEGGFEEVTMAQLGFTPQHAYRCQVLAKIPEDDFKAHIQATLEKNEELTLKGALHLAEKLKSTQHERANEDGYAGVDPLRVVIQRGDLIELGGRHRILCDDSLERKNIERLLGGRTPHIVHADPPYGIDLMGGKARKLGPEGLVYEPVIGDDKPFDPSPFLELAPIVFMWGANHFANRLPNSAFWLVWHKSKSNPFNFADGELCWCNISKPARILYHLWSGYMRDSEVNVRRIHPMQKPIAVITWVLSFFDGDLVLEPFLGSGSTIMACEQMNRTCYGLELSPKYCQLMVDRYLAANPSAAVTINGQPVDWVKYCQTG